MEKDSFADNFGSRKPVNIMNVDGDHFLVAFDTNGFKVTFFQFREKTFILFPNSLSYKID